MKRVTLRNLLFLFGAIFLLAFLLEKSRSIYFSGHQHYSKALSQLREEYALLDQEIIKSRYEFAVSYDPLIKHLAALKRHQKNLEKIPKYIDQKGRKQINFFLEKNAEIIQQKEALLEPFKSQNSILKNSQHYLPLLIAEIHYYESSRHKRIYQELNELLDNILLYNFVSDEEMQGQIEAKIKQLSRYHPKHIARKDKELIKLSLAHVRLILRTKPQIDALTNQILELPVQLRTQELEAAYIIYYQKANERVNYYQFYGSCAFLIIIIIGFSLALKKLSKARQAALEASNIKSQFLANMSHEIRTPMNGILGMASLLTDTKIDEEQQEFVEIIQVSAKNLLNIINDILDFSKLEAGEMQIENLKFNLRDCIENVVDLLSSQAQKKELELIPWIDREVPKQLQGDPTRLRQVLINLVSNAIKFTDSGEVVLRVSVISQPSEKPNNSQNLWLNFSVIDTGIGIAAKDRGKLFKSFSQIDASTTRKYGGTGLGLVICKQLVELMGGTIGVKSQVGVGSTFWFIIPFKKGQIKEENEKKYRNLEGRKLLIAGNDNNRSELLKYYTSDWGMQVDLITNEREALNILQAAVNQSHPYELVLLDLSIYKQMISESQPTVEQIAATKFILLVTSSQREEAQKMLQREIVNYIVVPISESKLIETLLKAINTPITASNLGDTAGVTSS